MMVKVVLVLMVIFQVKVVGPGVNGDVPGVNDIPGEGGLGVICVSGVNGGASAVPVIMEFRALIMVMY